MLASNRPYDAFYRRPGQTMHSMLHDQLIQDPYTGQYGSKRDTPELETKPNITHRKRVPVACDRCRKRKIKCSGDQGDGSGCDNCRSAGYDSCQFLRVRSSLLDCPTMSSSRSWHGSHFHPYSSRSRNLHHLQQSQYVPQAPSLYQGWSNSIDYAGMTNSTPTTIPWNHSNYAPTFGLYDSDGHGSYATQPPSYMQPDPHAELRSSIHNGYVGPMMRSQQQSLWLGNLDTQTLPQQNSQIYPLTPAESTKGYNMLGGHIGQHPLSNERAFSLGRLSTPGMTTTLPSIPSHGRDTPPLSAVSHRSSHTWNTDTASHVSAASSRTSCGGSQDLSNGQTATCDDQAAVYPYPTETTSPHVTIPASALPIATDAIDHEQQQLQTQSNTNMGLPQVDESNLILHGRVSRDSLRTASPVSTLYSYNTTRSRSSRRSHAMHSQRLLSSNYASSWDQAAMPDTQDTSLTGQQLDSEQLHEHRGSTTSLPSSY